MARRFCHFSMDDLVRRMGDGAVSKMAISKIERGLMRPSATTLQAIATACRLPVTFFSQPLPDLDELECRFSQSVTQEQRKLIKTIVGIQLQSYFGVQAALDESLPFVHPMPGTVLRNYADAETAALKLRRKWEIGLHPIHAYCHVKAMVAI